MLPNTDSVRNATYPSTFPSLATLMTICFFFSCVSIGASSVFGGGVRGATHRSLQQLARPSYRCTPTVALDYRILDGSRLQVLTYWEASNCNIKLHASQY